MQDAIAIRDGEGAFDVFRAGLSAVLRDVGRSAEGESPQEFARRVQIAAADHLEAAEANLLRLQERGQLARALPGVVSLAIGIGMKHSPLPVPGAGAAARAGVGVAVKRGVKDGAAAEVALTYTSNLRFAGRL